MNTEKLVESMSREQVVAWAGLLHVEYERVPWPSEGYSNREDALRVALVDTIDEKLVSQREEGVPSLTMADRRYLGTLMRDELIEELNDPDVQTSLMELLYEKFFTGDKKKYAVKYEGYEKLVSKCCDSYYKMYREAIEKLLREMS